MKPTSDTLELEKIKENLMLDPFLITKKMVKLF